MRIETKPFPSDDFMPHGLSTERMMQAGFAFTLVCLGVIGIMSYLSVNRLREDAEWTRHTEEVISSLRLLLSHVTDAETSQRGYAIVGEESYLGPYHQAQRDVDADLQFLRKLTADNAAQQRRLDAIAPVIAKRMTRLGAMVELQRSQGFAAVQAAMTTGVGKQLHDQIRTLTGEMETAEQGLLKQRQVRAKRGSAMAKAIIIGGSVLALGAVAVALFAVGKDFARRRAHAAQAALAGRLSRTGAWALELPGSRYTWSDEVCAIHEVAPGFAPTVEEAVNYCALEFRETIRGALEACVRDGTSFDVDLQLITAKGCRIWVRAIGEAERNAAGVIRRVQGALQDITKRKHSEAALEQAYKELVEASRQTAIAEFATGVLHNVGNVLNSVNIASTCVADSLKRSKAANLSKVVTLLREHEKDLGDFFINDPKGRQVPVYLAELAEHLAGEQADALKELAGLQKNIEHIKDIVTMQQSSAKTSNATEAIDLTDLVEDALHMNSSELAGHGIEVIKEFEDIPVFTADKHKLLQILVNLVRNAAHACETSDLRERELTIRTANGKGRVHITVGDNGVGIPPKNLDRIFSHGFTTKKNGHGFGLHSAALAAKEMGGSLTVHSDGPGQGAAFTLELPCPTRENADE